MSKNIVKKRGNSYIAGLIVFGTILIIFSLIIIISIRYDKEIISITNGHQIARKYMLKMESKGELTSNDKEMLIRDLENQGFTDVIINTNSNTKVPYGTEINLDINMKINHTILINNGSYKIGNELKNVNISKTSTSKR